MALTAALAIFASFAGCSDKGDKKDENAKETIVAENDSKTEAAESKEIADITAAASLSPEEYNSVAKHDLEIKPFTPGEGEVVQDAVEGGDTAGNSTSGDNVAGNSNNATGGNSTAIGNAAVADNDPGSNNADLPEALQVYNGTRTTMQAFWLDLSKESDYVFDGEYLVAEFKIKDNTADGIYPVTLDWLDFCNWNCDTIKFTGIDGAVIVGGEAVENKFNDDSAPQIMVSNASGKPGETVKVAISLKNNPGIVSNLLRFSYNSDVLEYVGGGEGANFNGHFS